MQARPNHESPGPSVSSVSSRPQVGATGPVLPDPQPATGKEEGRAMVLRRNRARRVLLRTGDDHAAGARRPIEGCNFLPWRSDHGPAERLDKLLPQICLVQEPVPCGSGLFIRSGEGWVHTCAPDHSLQPAPAPFSYNWAGPSRCQIVFSHGFRWNVFSCLRASLLGSCTRGLAATR